MAIQIFEFSAISRAVRLTQRYPQSAKRLATTKHWMRMPTVKEAIEAFGPW